MSDEIKSKLENRKAEIQTEFDAIKAEHSAISKKLSENQARQVQLQGAYQEVEKLLETPTEETPKEEKKK